MENEIFQTIRGDYPVQEFINKQDIATKAKVILSIKLLTTQGPFLSPPYSKKLQDKLYELRISGVIRIRVFYTIYKNEYYLLHAFKKKTQKTPVRELKIAIDRMREIILFH